MCFFFHTKTNDISPMTRKTSVERLMSPGPKCLDMGEELLIVYDYYMLFIRQNPKVVPRIECPVNAEHKRTINC
nr:L [Bat picornavirus 2] [Bat picornavirus 2]